MMVQIESAELFGESLSLESQQAFSRYRKSVFDFARFLFVVLFLQGDDDTQWELDYEAKTSLFRVDGGFQLTLLGQGKLKQEDLETDKVGVMVCLLKRGLFVRLGLFAGHAV
jgi:hypothetical protein